MKYGIDSAPKGIRLKQRCDVKRIEMSEHAWEQVFKRNIGDAQIEDCIENPDSEEPDRKDRVRVEKVFSGKRLRVIYREASHYYQVITAMWVSGG